MTVEKSRFRPPIRSCRARLPLVGGQRATLITPLREIAVQFLVVFHPKDKFRTEGPPADFAQVEQAEQVQAKALYKSGGIRQLWALKNEGRGAVGLFEAASPDELQSMIASFPMVQKDYADHEVFPLGPFAAFRRMNLPLCTRTGRVPASMARGSCLNLDCPSDAARCAARSPCDLTGNEEGLRPRTVRRLHGDRRRPARPLVSDASRELRWAGRWSRSRASRPKPSCTRSAAGLHPP